MSIENLPKKYQHIILIIKDFEKYNEYIGAFIFGSVARNEVSERSDVDVKIITDRKTNCQKINHPFVKGVKLDISFNSSESVEKDTNQEIKNKKRIPMIAESIIVFDKTGLLEQLKKKALLAKPELLPKKNYCWSKFMIYHAHDKAHRFLETDPASSILSMGININEILKDHYKLHGRWWVSNKRILRDLDNWDPKLAKLLRKFALAKSANEKYNYYLKISDYISKPMGDWKNLEENNCNCELCRLDLEHLSS